MDESDWCNFLFTQECNYIILMRNAKYPFSSYPFLKQRCVIYAFKFLLPSFILCTVSVTLLTECSLHRLDRLTYFQAMQIKSGALHNRTQVIPSALLCASAAQGDILTLLMSFLSRLQSAFLSFRVVSWRVNQIVGLISPSPLSPSCLSLGLLSLYFSTRSGFFLARSPPLCLSSPFASFVYRGLDLRHSRPF